VLTLLAWLGQALGSTAWTVLPPGQTRLPDTYPVTGLIAPEDEDAPAPTSASFSPPTDLSVALLWPDLRTLPPSDFEIRNLSRGRRMLRLANTVWNSGQGPLELMGKLNPVTQQTRVQQRLYAEDGAVDAYDVGEFVWHPGHDHWHFEDFAVYQLWSLTPHGELERVVASSIKLSYCLIDTDVANSAHPGFDPRRHYQGCGRTLQGLSIGWGDQYDSFLEGQSLDITGLPDGVYGLVSQVNPGRRLLEADYTNNSAVIYLRLLGDEVVVALPPDLDQVHCRAWGWC
jgi:hypothetical protein